MRSSLAILLAIVFGAGCHARGMRLAADLPLANGRVFAANLRQDSLKYYSTAAAIENYSVAAIRSIKPYAPNKAPAEFGICAGVAAVDMRTTPSSPP